MYTKEQVEREKNILKRSYENILIDIMFSLVDIEEIMDTNAFPIEEVQKKIEELKINIGRKLED